MVNIKSAVLAFARKFRRRPSTVADAVALLQRTADDLHAVRVAQDARYEFLGKQIEALYTERNAAAVESARAFRAARKIESLFAEV